MGTRQKQSLLREKGKKTEKKKSRARKSWAAVIVIAAKSALTKETRNGAQTHTFFAILSSVSEAPSKQPASQSNLVFVFVLIFCLSLSRGQCAIAWLRRRRRQIAVIKSANLQRRLQFICSVVHCFKFVIHNTSTAAAASASWSAVCMNGAKHTNNNHWAAELMWCSSARQLMLLLLPLRSLSPSTTLSLLFSSCAANWRSLLCVVNAMYDWLKGNFRCI